MRLKSLSDPEKDLDHLLKIGDGGATTYHEAPIFDSYSDSDDDSKPLSDCHLGLTITSTLQARFMYWKGMEPLSYSNMTPALWSSHKNGLFREAGPSLPSLSKERARHNSLTTDPVVNSPRIIKSTWPPSTIMRTTKRSPEESMMMNYSRRSPPTSTRLMLPKTKMRRAEESDGSRTLSVPSVGGT
jgi:hypothetical protein